MRILGFVIRKIFNKKRKDGAFEDLYENGLILQKGMLKNGRLDGISTIHYETGELNDIAFYKNSLICWSKGYYKSGNLESKTFYKDGKELKSYHYQDRSSGND